jgi:hypothetical protein
VVAGVLVDGWGAADLGTAGADVALVAWTTVKGAAADSDLSTFLAEVALAAVFSALSGAGEVAWPNETEMAARNAIVPQVSLHVKVAIVVVRC